MIAYSYSVDLFRRKFRVNDPGINVFQNMNKFFIKLIECMVFVKRHHAIKLVRCKRIFTCLGRLGKKIHNSSSGLLLHFGNLVRKVKLV